LAQEIWARATAKWRGILVYSLLQACMRFTTTLIYQSAHTPGLRMYASLAGLATSLYTLVRTWQLLMTDTEGDENWPPIWS
jgi:hypothetical protein